MSNEELAVQAQNGDRDALLALWDQTRKLAWNFIVRWKQTAGLAGMEAADCEQVCFLGLMQAVKYYDANSKYHFLSYFGRCVQNALADAVGRTEKRKREPLKTAASLDVPASPDAPEDSTLLELLPDPAAVEAFDHAEASGDLEPFLESLPMDQQSALYRRYWLDLPLNQTERKAHAAALKALRHPRNSIRLRALL